MNHYPRVVGLVSDRDMCYLWRIIETAHESYCVEKQVGTDAMKHPIWEPADYTTDLCTALLAYYGTRLSLDMDHLEHIIAGEEGRADA